jgi:hypothetical protein
MTASLSVVAQRFSFVRETEGPNWGAWVALFLRFVGIFEPASWCCAFISFCLDVAYMGKSPLRKSGLCQDLYVECQRSGFIVANPAVDDLYFFLDEHGVAHHIGVVTAAAPLAGFAGNTSEDGLSTNGTGAFNHELKYPRERIRFARLPK